MGGRELMVAAEGMQKHGVAVECLLEEFMLFRNLFLFLQASN